MAAPKERFDEMSLERWAKLREVERHQLNTAEKYFGKGEWKIAIAEYEKYLKLYETSEAAPYSQMKWSICQVHLRKLNTAIKDGFQSVIDYWPDSPEAVKSSYLIAETYKDMGQALNAKKAYAKVIETHPDDVVAVRSKRDLLELARKENDEKKILAILNDLTFTTKRTADSQSYCVTSARELSEYFLYRGEFDEAVKALETSYKDESLTRAIYEISHGPIQRLTGDAAKKVMGEKLADAVIARIEGHIPLLTDDKQKAHARGYYYWIAEVHSRAKRDDVQLKVFQQMEKLFGVDDGLLGQFALWYRNHNKRDLARAMYARFENQVTGQSNIALMWREEKKWDEAIAVYEGLEKTDSERAGNWRWQIAECYDSSGRLKEAIHSYRLSDRYPQCLTSMASCHRRLKEYQPAIELYAQVITAYPDQGASARFEMAKTYEQMDKQENAIRAYQQVCRDYPRSGHASEAHAHLQNKYKINVTLGGAKEE
ncbi:MAG: tetratricopeptide repeat protein [Phycisphaeraceae bacterium]